MLPIAERASLLASKATTAHFQHEPGWDAWMLQQDNVAAGRKYLRRTYGNLPSAPNHTPGASRSKDESNTDSEQEDENEDQDEDDGNDSRRFEPFIEDEDSQDEQQTRSQKKSFLKPGSTKASPKTDKKASANKRRAKEEHVVTARKKKSSGKRGISAGRS